jgi:UDP-GlcNAc:undecaprenyl-phosphate GlcNAc-1-phosphate transferase
MGVIALGGLALVVMGLIDDKRGLPARLKFFLQFVIAFFVVLLSPDVRATVFIGGEWASIIITVLWIVGITNAFNLLDNMDALSAGCALIASLIFMVITMQAGQAFVCGLLLVFAGALLGFLRYNRPPARIFMGDAGSTFVGYFLAVLTVLSTFYHHGQSKLFPIAMPLLVLAVPLFDTFSVMYIRWRAGKPFFVGDNNHLSHRLVRLGMTKEEAVASILLITFCVGLSALLLPQLNLIGAIIVLLQALSIFAIVTILEYVGKRAKSDENGPNGNK